MPLADPAAALPPQVISSPRASDSLAAALRFAFPCNEILSDDFLGLLTRIERREQRTTQSGAAPTPDRALD